MLVNGKTKLQLVTTGCSFTYGYGLSDLDNAWPKQLANRLNLNCVNLARPGMGNEFCIKSLIEYFTSNRSLKQNSLVVIGLTSYLRQEFLHKNSEEFFYTIPNTKKEREFIEQFYIERFNSRFYYLKYLRNIICLQSLLCNWQIPYVLFEVLHNDHDKYMQDTSAIDLRLEINTTNSYKLFEATFAEFTHGFSRLPDGHPDVDAHLQMAKTLTDHIINKFTRN
jgi:hypothetical protein